MGCKGKESLYLEHGKYFTKGMGSLFIGLILSILGALGISRWPQALGGLYELLLFCDGIMDPYQG